MISGSRRNLWVQLAGGGGGWNLWVWLVGVVVLRILTQNEVMITKRLLIYIITILTGNGYYSNNNNTHCCFSVTTINSAPTIMGRAAYI